MPDKDAKSKKSIKSEKGKHSQAEVVKIPKPEPGTPISQKKPTTHPDPKAEKEAKEGGKVIGHKPGYFTHKIHGSKTQNIILLPFGVTSAILAIMTLVAGFYFYSKLYAGTPNTFYMNKTDCKTEKGGYTEPCKAWKNRKVIGVVIILMAILQIIVGAITAVFGLICGDGLTGYLCLPYSLSHAVFGVTWVMIVVHLCDIYFRRIPVRLYDYDPEFYARPDTYMVFVPGGSPVQYVEYDRFRRLYGAPEGHDRKEQYVQADIVKFIVAFNAIFCMISCCTLFGIGAVLYMLTHRAIRVQQDQERRARQLAKEQGKTGVEQVHHKE